MTTEGTAGDTDATLYTELHKRETYLQSLGGAMQRRAEGIPLEGETSGSADTEVAHDLVGTFAEHQGDSVIADSFVGVTDAEVPTEESDSSLTDEERKKGKAFIEEGRRQRNYKKLR